jgi:hypothetical protein
MNRETIELSEHIVRSLIDENYDEDDGYIEEEDLGFKFIDESVEYTDLEKSYETKSVILKRESDNKYFKFNYIDSIYRYLFEDEIFPLKLKEVFPKQITTTIYV